MVSRLDGGQGLVYIAQGVVGCTRVGGVWHSRGEVQGYIGAGTRPFGLTAGCWSVEGTTGWAACTGLALGWLVNVWRTGRPVGHNCLPVLGIP